jgi:lipopolysaccharide transport system permease protein
MLLLSFVRRQYQLRYRQSFAGVLWAVIPPLASLAVATLVFHEVIGVETGSVSYPLFVLAGLAPWSFFQTGLSTGVSSIVSQQSMVSRLAFPRSVIPFSILGTGLIDLGITSLLFIGFAIITGAGIPLTALWAPPLLLIEIVFTAGIVLLGSALNMFVRDVKLAVPLLAQLWLYLTPVVYPLDTVPDRLRPFFLANPMTGLIESFRDVLIHGHSPDPGLLTPSIVGTVLVFVVGAWYFTATEPRFADVI